MAEVFANDESLWNQSTTPPVSKFTKWTFGRNFIWIGTICCELHDDGLPAFELALFDAHYMYWHTSATGQYSHNYNYHTRLRAAIEDYFKGVKGHNLRSPEVLTPWLWRTFCGCTHIPEGRNDFMELIKRYGAWKDEGMPAPSLDEWERALKTPSVQLYLPRWLEISKDHLGFPEKKTRLYAWQFHVFLRACPSSTIAAEANKPLKFVDTPIYAFFSKEERSTMPWIRLLADPSLVCPRSTSLVDHKALQKLNPGAELDDSILGSYIDLCRAQNKDKEVKLISTYFWPQVSNLDHKDYGGATRLLSAELVTKNGQKVKRGWYAAALSSINETLETLKSLYIPVNQNQNHWLLLRMNFTDRRWEFYDSMTACGNAKTRAGIIKVSKKAVSDYLTTEVNYNLSGWNCETDMSVPQQKGSTDCGVYTCQYLKWLVNGMAIPSVLEEADVADFRNMMIMELVSGKLRIGDRKES